MQSITLYNGMGEVMYSGLGTCITRTTTGQADWDIAEIKTKAGYKLKGYLKKVTAVAVE
jgi:hypothetical protein